MVRGLLPLAVSRGHPLAGRGAASAEDLADYETAWATPGALYDTIVPPHTPSGRPVRCTRAVAGLPLAQRSDIILLPLAGLPPMRLGPIWCTAHENARIRALATTAATRRQTR